MPFTCSRLVDDSKEQNLTPLEREADSLASLTARLEAGSDGAPRVLEWLDPGWLVDDLLLEGNVRRGALCAL